MNFRTFEAYNSTLQQLKHALLASKVFFSIETVTSIVCLATVEVSVVASLDWSLVIIPICQLMFPTSSAGLFAHFAGFNALVKSYPPDLFSSDDFHEIFVGCRPILVSFMMFGSLAPGGGFDRIGSFFHALDTRKSTFLTKDEWRTLQFRNHPPSDIQLLMSDTAMLPSLLEAVDLLGSLPADRAISEAHQIKAGLLEVHESLSEWKCLYEMDAIRPSCHSWQKHGSTHTANAESCLYFPNILTGNLHTHTWVLEIIYLTEMEKVDLFLADRGCTEAGQALEENYYTQACELANNICHSAEYFLQEGMRLFGPASAIFPLRIAYNVLSRDCQGNQENIKWCQGLIVRIRQKGFSTIPHFPAEFAEL